MKRYRLPLALMMALMMVMHSCDLLDCTEGNVSMLRIQVYDIAGNSHTLPDTLTVKAAGTDYILINRDTWVNNMQLPLSYHLPVDTFIMELKGKGYRMEDTLFVEKTNEVYFESPDCPTMMMHKLLGARVKGVFLESAAIEHQKVDFEENTHLKLVVKNF